jgi:signal transduction histidine kinase
MFPASPPSSLDSALLEALVAERKLSEERALLPGMLQHDLANVLCHVTLASSMLDAVMTEEQRSVVTREVQGGVKRMNELLAGMRVLYDHRAGAGDFRRADFAGFLTDLVRTKGVWPAGAPIHLDVPAMMWCTFSPTLVRHAIVNLIGNAVAYSGGTWVRVRLSRVGGNRWQVAIANGGPGIPANHVPYLFELGHRANITAKSTQPGLGLYITRMCLRLHGSTLRVRSRPRVTVFAFTMEGPQRGASLLDPVRP